MSSRAPASTDKAKGRRKITVKRLRIRTAYAVLAVASVAVLAVALATSGGAAVPAAGVNCQTDGKFSGRGATFQKRAMDALIAGYTVDVCGNVPDGPSGNDLVQYNKYDAASPDPVLTGSGYGRKAMICRTDGYGGTDGPYNVAQLAALNGDPHAQGTLDTISGGTPGSRNCQSTATPTTAVGFGTAFYPPYQPINGVSPNPSSYPNAADATASMMSFPVGGSAVAI